MNGVHVSYSLARQSFLKAATQAGAAMASYTHPLHKGPRGEDLAIDVAHIGPQTGRTLLLISSGVHGVEGTAGSKAQTAFLHSRLYAQLPAATAVCLVHAVNPYGFAYSRRVNEEGVDLNRNFIDWRQAPPPTSELTSSLNSLILTYPASPSGNKEIAQTLASYIRQTGVDTFDARLAKGQYNVPGGLCYGGTGQSWSAQNWGRILDQHKGFERVVHLDLHTGYGPRHQVTVLPADYTDQQGFEKMRQWWGKQVQGEHQVAAALTQVSGCIEQSLLQVWQPAQIMQATLEVGLQPLHHNIMALIDDHRAHHCTGASARFKMLAARNMRNVYVPRAPEAQHNLRRALVQAVAGLTS